jgi:GDP-mannose 6-dehydrogenase
MTACLARLGHQVVGIDINPVKVQLLLERRSLIVEPGLDKMLSSPHTGRVQATTDATEAVHQSDISFVCVGTPSSRTGRIGLSSIQHVSEEIGAALSTKDGWHTIAIRSTVLPGTIESMIIPILEEKSGKRADVDFAVCANPEFIREGTAVRDFFNPPFTVIGANDSQLSAPVRAIYASLSGAVFDTSIRTAEMVKYACNAFHALKIDFANEIGSLAREAGVNPDEVMAVLCADTKLNISPAYLKPGFAFGGSCLPKDVSALAHYARQMDLSLPLLQSILPSNQAHIDRALESILATRKRRIGIFGLSFKSGTDDMRESGALQLVKRLLGEGYQVQVYDPNVSLSLIHGENRRYAETEIPHIFSLLRPTMEAVVATSDVLVIANGGDEYARVSQLATPEQEILNLAGARWFSTATTDDRPATPTPAQRTAA